MLHTILLISSALLMVDSLDPPPGYIWRPGPLITASKGEVWPLVQYQVKSEKFFTVNGNSFKFKVKSKQCNILKEALDRYENIIEGINRVQSQFLSDEIKTFNNDSNYLGELKSLDVVLTSNCSDSDFPTMLMQEKYNLTVSLEKRVLHSETIWGILRGLESFSQLIYLASDLRTLVINQNDIYDFPKFSHRGLLLDTSRHYIPKQYIYRLLDAMSYNKLNVFHWHIVDDYSFPYESITFPELSEKGRFLKGMTYDQEFIKDVQIYAQKRGIRVLPEFDVPGHTLSWGLGNPDLLTSCYNSDGKLSGAKGPIDPTKNSTYEFLYKLFAEVAQVFHDRFIHLGGDEVDFDCWVGSPVINQFMWEAAIPQGNYVALQSYFVQKMIDFTHSQNSYAIVWEEVFTNGVKLPKNTGVHVWKHDDYQQVLSDVTKAGYYTIFSACWYLDILETGGDWIKFYLCDAHNFNGTEEQKNLVLGGEACMWSELVDENNLESRIWPRASAAAEKLWSNIDGGINGVTILNAARRLEEHSCRMNNRGIGAQPPTGPSICPNSRSDKTLFAARQESGAQSLKEGFCIVFASFLFVIFNL